MVRFWFGIGLLLVFLIFGLWVAEAMDSGHMQISSMLEQAADAMLDGDPSRGIELAQQAYRRWQYHWHATAAVADHAPMDEIDSLFSQLQLYGSVRHQVDFAAYCTRLSRLIRAMGETHTLNWWNIL